MKAKVFAIAAAVMMMAVAGITIVESESSDATATNYLGTFTVYVSLDGGINWTSQDEIAANDGAQAIINATNYYQAATDSVQELYQSGQYVSMNDNYGDITTYNGKTNGTDGKYWTPYVLIDDTWTTLDISLGFYKCFDDYNEDYRTANIALVWGSVPASVPSYLTDTLQDLSDITEVSGNSDFLTTFYIKTIASAASVSYYCEDDSQVEVTSTTLASGVFISGYGSDAYLALIDAVNVNGDNFVGSDVIPVTSNYYYWYGWMNELFNLGTVQTDGQNTPHDWTDDTYAWWNIFEDYTVFGDQSNVLSDFNLGFIGAAGSANTDNEIALVFLEAGV